MGEMLDMKNEAVIKDSAFLENHSHACGCGCDCSANTKNIESTTVNSSDQNLIEQGLTAATFNLSGLDCADCAAKLEKKISQLDGVKSAKVNFGASKLTVEHSISNNRIMKAVEEAGYGVENADPGVKLKESVFRLTGLDCADCAAKLEKKFSAQRWVEDAKVNFGAAKLTIRHNGKINNIIQLVEESGYGAELDGPDKPVVEMSFWKNNRKTLLTAVSGILVGGGLVLSFIGLPKTIVIPMYIIAMVTGGYYVAKSGFYSLKALSLDMNFLMAVAAIGAAAIGEWSEGATVVFLFSLGNALQAYTMEKTRKSIRSLMDLAPKEALVRRDGKELKLPLVEIKAGDIIVVLPGERIAMDGKVLSGTSRVNQAPITGESMPVQKQPGDEVFAGTINEQGSLDIEVTKLVADTTLSKIIQMVEEAQAQKAPSQQFVDVFSKYYTPIVIFTAVAIAILPTLLFTQPFIPWFQKALILLVISCPCALVISTPVSIVSAIGSAAKKGVLIKGGAYLEAAGALKAIAFDKTGTLTTGRPEVTDVIPVGDVSIEKVIEIAAAIEKRSQHPVADAIIRNAQKNNIQAPEGDEFESITGKGAKTTIGGATYYIGNPRLFEDNGTSVGELLPKVTELQKEGKTVMLVGDSKIIFGIIAVADVVREASVAAIKQLKQVGVGKIIMLTGDNEGTAKAISEKVGVDEYYAELLPEDKLTSVKGLLAKYGSVGMVGDGINDAPALAAATIGIAMGGAGTDTALETADYALMGDDLSKLPYAIKLSRKALNVIKQNIGFSIIVKAVFLALTFAGMANLWMAVFADTGAALIVIANGMRLLRVKESI